MAHELCPACLQHPLGRGTCRLTSEIPAWQPPQFTQSEEWHRETARLVNDMNRGLHSLPGMDAPAPVFVVEPAPVAVVEPERPRPDIVKVHNFLMNRDNTTGSKLQVLDEAISIASGDDLSWLVKERYALVQQEWRERSQRRRYSEERELFFGKTKAKDPGGH